MGDLKLALLYIFYSLYNFLIISNKQLVSWIYKEHLQLSNKDNSI